MIQISTSAGPEKGIQNDCSSESLSEDDEALFHSFKEDLNKLSRSPKSETIEAILKFSKTL